MYIQSRAACTFKPSGVRRIEPLCFGVGKVMHARQWATEQSIDLKDCSFYTDSYSDLPMMEVVGKPVAVHPDPRLRHESRQRTWPIVDWS